MRGLPQGTVTFLFSDIEGSTRLLHELGERYAEVLAEHRRVVREAVARHRGVEVDAQGDGFFVAFASAREALAAAREAQEGLRKGQVRLRVGLHTGEPSLTEEGYVGMDVHRAARVAAAGHGGQVLLSQTTRDLVDADVRDLGEHRLKDLSAPERLYQLGPGDFPPLKTLFQTNLPVQPSPLLGRERELGEIAAFIRGGTRLLTLTGAGGSGKTRLALHAAAELADDFADGVWFVSLAATTDSALVGPTIAQVVGAPADLSQFLRGRELLLVLDNLEQLLPDAAAAIAGLPVRVIATSRERLAVSVEQEYEVLPLPRDDAVALFVERAHRLAPAFEPDEHVAAIVRRVDGLPLAVELAAARVKVLTPAQIEERLGQSLDLLTGGARDAPERQRTLRATIAWSHELLEPNEKRLFARLSVFAAGATFEGPSTSATRTSIPSRCSLTRISSAGAATATGCWRRSASTRSSGSTSAASTTRPHARWLDTFSRWSNRDLELSGRADLPPRCATGWRRNSTTCAPQWTGRLLPARRNSRSSWRSSRVGSCARSAEALSSEAAGWRGACRPSVTSLLGRARLACTRPPVSPSCAEIWSSRSDWPKEACASTAIWVRKLRQSTCSGSSVR